MVLVDTSVLIAFFKDESTQEVLRFDYIISHDIPFGINNFIYQELLQGSKTEKELRLLQEYLSTQKFYHLLHGKDSFTQAASLYMKCRKKGITVRSTVDMLIVETVLENELLLLHNDRDFIKIGTVVKELKFY